MQRQRDLGRYAGDEKSLIDHDSLSTFLKSPVDSGVHEIAYGSGTLDLMLDQTPSNNLLVFFHAAASLTHTTPIFTGRRLAQSANASALFVSDPSLDLGVRIGWSVGDENRPLQTDFTAGGSTRDVKHTR